MKKSLISLILLTCFGLEAQNVNIVDVGLKNWLLGSNTTTRKIAKDLNGEYIAIDTNGDGEIQVSEALNISSLRISPSNAITSFVGINEFQNLENLIFLVAGNTIGMDLSGLSKLKYLHCRDLLISSINLSGCVSLEELFLSNNFLTNLDLNDLLNLRKLECHWNHLSSLNLNTNIQLKELNCSSNNIYQLNLQYLTQLEVLRCESLNLASLNVLNNTQLKEIYCGGNNLNQLDISNLSLLENLSCTSNNLTNIIFNNNFNLKNLGIRNNHFNTINLNSFPLLEVLSCEYNQFTSIDVSNNHNLIEFRCNNNNLNNLNLSSNTNLKILYCNNNTNLPNLDVSMCNLLETLYCSYCKLTLLDISECSNLHSLRCNNNYSLRILNINNGFEWTPNYSFYGNYLYNIFSVCTTENNVEVINSYYNSIGYYPTVTSDCSVLEVNDLSVFKSVIYPNPVTDFIYFKDKLDFIKIYDLKGNLIIQSDVSNLENLDISSLKSGVYFANIQVGNKWRMEKIMKI